MRLGTHVTDEQRARYGHPQSEETRAKISAAHLNPSPETRAKLSAAHMGKPHPKKGCACSLITRAKLSMANWKGGSKVRYSKKNAKRRTLGFIPLNAQFAGCEGHHINKSDVIYLPRKLHRSVYHNQWTGKGMVAMNVLAGQYLTEGWT